MDHKLLKGTKRVVKEIRRVNSNENEVDSVYRSQIYSQHSKSYNKREVKWKEKK